MSKLIDDISLGKVLDHVKNYVNNNGKCEVIYGKGTTMVEKEVETEVEVAGLEWVEYEYQGKIKPKLGRYVWTDGSNYYYSDNDDQYIYADGQWVEYDWSNKGYKPVDARNIWKDYDGNIYYSDITVDVTTTDMSAYQTEEGFASITELYKLNSDGVWESLPSSGFCGIGRYVYTLDNDICCSYYVKIGDDFVQQNVKLVKSGESYHWVENTDIQKVSRDSDKPDVPLLFTGDQIFIIKPLHSNRYWLFFKDKDGEIWDDYGYVVGYDYYLEFTKIKDFSDVWEYQNTIYYSDVDNNLKWTTINFIDANWNSTVVPNSGKDVYIMDDVAYFSNNDHYYKLNTTRLETTTITTEVEEEVSAYLTEHGDTLQKKLTAGDGIKLNNDTISVRNLKDLSYANNTRSGVGEIDWDYIEQALHGLNLGSDPLPLFGDEVSSICYAVSVPVNSNGDVFVIIMLMVTGNPDNGTIDGGAVIINDISKFDVDIDMDDSGPIGIFASMLEPCTWYTGGIETMTDCQPVDKLDQTLLAPNPMLSGIELADDIAKMIYNSAGLNLDGSPYIPSGSTATISLEEKLNDFQDKLIPGNGITINGNRISADIRFMRRYAPDETDDDAAYEILGDMFRIPSNDDWRELMSKCNWEWINDWEETGVCGYKVSNKEDSTKFIFLPGYDDYSTVPSQITPYSSGYYMSSDISSEYYENECSHFYFYSSNRYLVESMMYYGTQIRPVCLIKSSDGINRDDINVEVVDLGVSVGWCTSNLTADGVADECYEPGGFFGWGDTEPKISNFGDNRRANRKPYTRLGYISGYYGANNETIIDDKDDDVDIQPIVSKTVVDIDDDINIYGYRTPTYSEWEELFEYTTQELAKNDDDEITGIIFTGNYIDNKLYIPLNTNSNDHSTYYMCGDYYGSCIRIYIRNNKDVSYYSTTKTDGLVVRSVTKPSASNYYGTDLGLPSGTRWRDSNYYDSWYTSSGTVCYWGYAGNYYTNESDPELDDYYEKTYAYDNRGKLFERLGYVYKYDLTEYDIPIQTELTAGENIKIIGSEISSIQSEIDCDHHFGLDVYKRDNVYTLNAEVEYTQQNEVWSLVDEDDSMVHMYGIDDNFYLPSKNYLWFDYNNRPHYARYRYNDDNIYLYKPTPTSDWVTDPRPLPIPLYEDSIDIDCSSVVWVANTGIIHADYKNYHYYLDKETSKWKKYIWNGNTDFFNTDTSDDYEMSRYGRYLWKDYDNVVHFDHGRLHYYLDELNNEWKEYEWNDDVITKSFYYYFGQGIWRDYDGTIRYSPSNYPYTRCYKLERDNKTWVSDSSHYVNPSYIWRNYDGTIRCSNYMKLNESNNWETITSSQSYIAPFMIYDVLYYTDGSNLYERKKFIDEYRTYNGHVLQKQLNGSDGVIIENNTVVLSTADTADINKVFDDIIDR